MMKSLKMRKKKKKPRAVLPSEDCDDNIAPPTTCTLNSHGNGNKYRPCLLFNIVNICATTCIDGVHVTDESHVIISHWWMSVSARL